MPILFNNAFAQEVSNSAVKTEELSYLLSVEFLVDGAISLFFILALIYGAQFFKRLIDGKIEQIRQTFEEAESLREEAQKELRDVNHRAQSLEEELKSLYLEQKEKEKTLQKTIDTAYQQASQKLHYDFERRRKEMEVLFEETLKTLAADLLVGSVYSALQRSLDKDQRKALLRANLESVPKSLFVS